MKITKEQLRKIIKEELLKEAKGTRIPGTSATLDFLNGELRTWRPEALERLISIIDAGGRFDLTEDVLKMASDELATYIYDSKG